MIDIADDNFNQNVLNSLLGEMLYRLTCIDQSTLISSDIKNSLWSNIYKKVIPYDFDEVFTTIEMLYSFNPDVVSFEINKPYALSACVYDLKIHNGDIYCAVYFSLNSKLGQACLNNGFIYSLKKNIWFKKITLDKASLNESCDIFRMEMNPFLIEILGFIHILISRATMKKYFNFGFVGGMDNA